MSNPYNRWDMASSQWIHLSRRNYKHKYFFVDKFYGTDFKKVSTGAPIGARIFDLTGILNTDKIPEVEQIAEILKEKTWE